MVWQDGETRLLDFGPADGTPLLVVPSLVNRGYILDLTAERSLLRFLAGRDIRPLLIDWGWPGAVERGFDVGDHIVRRVEPALDAAAALCGRDQVMLGGYCMGGTMALAAALRRPERVSKLVLLAAPWDFHAAADDAQAQARALLDWAEPVMKATGVLPIDAIQAAFASLEPDAILAKFRGFGAAPQDDARATLFVAIEDWLGDGVPLPAPVARECLSGWYDRNLPAARMWIVGGTPVRPDALRVPTLVVVPERDRIVPPQSARPLAALVPGATLLSLPAGHVGMVAGPRGPSLLWEPLAGWLLG